MIMENFHSLKDTHFIKFILFYKNVSVIIKKKKSFKIQNLQIISFSIANLALFHHNLCSKTIQYSVILRHLGNLLWKVILKNYDKSDRIIKHFIKGDIIMTNSTKTTTKELVFLRDY